MILDPLIEDLFFQVVFTDDMCFKTVHIKLDFSGPAS